MIFSRPQGFGLSIFLLQRFDQMKHDAVSNHHNMCQKCACVFTEFIRQMHKESQMHKERGQTQQNANNAK